jgi:hypothetical protein
MSLRKRSIRILGAVLAVYALLVATHLGEFWPFSIYPMFSQAGQPWTRAVVREMPDDVDRVSSWDAVPFQDLPGKPYPLVPRGINTNDVANYVSKVETWTPERRNGLRNLFVKSQTLDRPVLVMRVRGALQNDSVAVRATPVMLVTNDTLDLHPKLMPSSLAALPPSGASNRP